MGQDAAYQEGGELGLDESRHRDGNIGLVSGDLFAIGRAAATLKLPRFDQTCAVPDCATKRTPRALQTL